MHRGRKKGGELLGYRKHALSVFHRNKRGEFIADNSPRAPPSFVGSSPLRDKSRFRASESMNFAQMSASIQLIVNVIVIATWRSKSSVLSRRVSLRQRDLEKPPSKTSRFSSFSRVISA